LWICFSFPNGTHNSILGKLWTGACAPVAAMSNPDTKQSECPAGLTPWREANRSVQAVGLIQTALLPERLP